MTSGRRDAKLVADDAREPTVDLTVARHRGAPPRILPAQPDAVSPALPDLAAPVIGEVPLQIAEPHEVMVTRSGSLLAP